MEPIISEKIENGNILINKKRVSNKSENRYVI